MESDISQEQGIEATDPDPVERCEGQVLGGTAGLPNGSAQTWAPEAEENQTIEELPEYAEEGNVANGISEEDSLWSNEFNFDADLFSSNTRTKERQTRSARRQCHQDWTCETFTRGDLIKEQEIDEELQQWKEKEKPAYMTYRDGVLCR